MARAVPMARVIPRNFNASLMFNGAGSKVRSAVIPNLHLGCTFAAYIRPTSLVGNTSIIENSIGTNSRITLMKPGNVVAAGYFNGTAYTSKSSEPIVIGRWYMCIFTWDGSATQLYIDNVAQVGAVSPQSNGTPNFTVGARGDDSNAFIGNIAQVMIWNRALTATEAAYVFSTGTAPTSGLVRKYNLDEGSGTTAIDTSTGGVNGAVTGATWSTIVPLAVRQTATGRVLASGRVAA